MKMQRLFLATLSALLLCAASGCIQPRVLYVVPTSSAPVIEGYGKEGSTIEWYASNGEGPFTVVFTSAPPCTSSSNLHATADKPATCKLHLPKHHPAGVLRFSYYIRHDAKREGDGSDDGPYGQRVGSCGSCSAIELLQPGYAGKARTGTTATPPPNYFPEAVSCETSPPGVVIDPVKPSIGDTVQWYSSTGQNWTITFKPTSACPSTMTQAQGNDTCTVAGTSGQSYPSGQSR
jgi:hypothetical protein